MSSENDSVGSSIPDLVAPESCSSDDESTIEQSISTPKWSKKITKIKRHTFRRPLRNMSDLKKMKELQVFELVFTPTVMKMIVHYSNNYNQALNLNVAELKLFLGLHILMSLCDKPNISEYWHGPSDPAYTPHFASCMSRDRFHQIRANLNFYTATNPEPTDKLYKIRSLLDTIVPKWSEINNLDKELSLDESMIPTKGKLPAGMKVFEPRKRVRFGIKVYVLAESKSGYVQEILLHQGNKNTASDYVTKLTKPYEKQGRWIAFDNFYSSYQLFVDMYDRGFHCVGTVRRNRRGVPEVTKRKSTPGPGRQRKEEVQGRMEKFSASYLESQHNVQHIKFRDNSKEVHVFSTLPLKKGYVTATRWTKVKNIQQKVKIDLPVQIHQYNKLMGGVDLVDSIKGKAKRTLMTKRWTLKVFHYLLEISIFNVFTLQKKSGKDVGTYTQFKSRLCSQLIDSRTPQTRTEGHYPRRSDTSRDCAYCSSRICSSKRVRSTIYCSKCGVFLCIDPCFEQYHENIDKFSAPACNNHTFATDSHTPPKNVKRKHSTPTKSPKSKRTQGS